MGRHLVLAAHLGADDVERRYRTAKQAVERTWAIARSTGYSRGWVCQVVKRYNEVGPEGLHDRRRTHSRRQPPALSEEQQAELLAVVGGRRRAASCGRDDSLRSG